MLALIQNDEIVSSWVLSMKESGGADTFAAEWGDVNWSKQARELFNLR